MTAQKHRRDMTGCVVLELVENWTRRVNSGKRTRMEIADFDNCHAPDRAE